VKGRKTVLPQEKTIKYVGGTVGNTHPNRKQFPEMPGWRGSQRQNHLGLLKRIEVTACGTWKRKQVKEKADEQRDSSRYMTEQT